MSENSILHSTVTEAFFNDRIAVLKSRLIFKTTALDAKLAEYAERSSGDESERSLGWLRTDTLNSAEDIVAPFRRRMESFPERQYLNIPKAISRNHPQWMSKFQGLIENLETGSIPILLGARGTGKTQMATIAARWLSEVKGLKSQYRVLGDLYAEIKGTFKSGSVESEDSILDGLTGCSLLVLDECHEITGTDWQGQILTRLIDARYRSNRPTILITNDTEQAFINSVGASIADRIAECGFLFHCDWQSFRRAAR